MLLIPVLLSLSAVTIGLIYIIASIAGDIRATWRARQQSALDRTLHRLSKGSHHHAWSAEAHKAAYSAHEAAAHRAAFGDTPNPPISTRHAHFD